MRTHYSDRTALVCDRLRAIGETHLGAAGALLPEAPQGTFYVIARFSALGLEDDLAVQRHLRDAYKGVPGCSHGVAVVPLSAFALPAALCLVRLCCALDVDVLVSAMDVVERCVAAAVAGRAGAGGGAGAAVDADAPGP